MHLRYKIIKSYYFALINNYQDFLLWCEKNNMSLIAFKKTISNQNKFCEFITNHYKKKNMLDNIENTKKFINKLHISDNITKNMRSFLLSNLIY